MSLHSSALGSVDLVLGGEPGPGGRRGLDLPVTHRQADRQADRQQTERQFDAKSMWLLFLAKILYFVVNMKC